MEKQPFVDRFPRKPWILHFYVCLLERKEQTIEDLREIQQQYWGNRRRVLLLSEQFGERMAVDHKIDESVWMLPLALSVHLWGSAYGTWRRARW